MARSEQSKLECETIIRWDETDSPAVLWTASPKVRKEWESYGFRPVVSGGGFRVECPVDRITYRTLKK